MRRAAPLTEDGASRRGAVVLGLSYTGIGAVHSLAELRPRPQPIVAVAFQGSTAPIRSRLAKVVAVPHPSRDGGLPTLDALRLVAAGAEAPPVLVPTEDDWAHFISRNRAELSRHFLFSAPDESAVELLLDKARLAGLARSLGIPCADYAVVAAGKDAPPPDGAEIAYPLVAKALTSLQEDPHHGTLRVRSFRSPLEWREFFSSAPLAAPVMIQRTVPGDDCLNYTYEGLWSERGEEIRAFCAQKLRQEPPQYGAATFAASRDVPEIVERSRRLLRHLAYRGLVDVDFKRSSADGEYYLMEVNPRLGGLHRLGTRLGRDLVQAAYRTLCGQAVTRADPSRCPSRTWCLMGRDLASSLRSLPSHPVRAIRRLLSYLSLPTDALFCTRDPGPWMDSMVQPIRRRLARSRLAGR